MGIKPENDFSALPLDVYELVEGGVMIETLTAGGGKNETGSAAYANCAPCGCAGCCNCSACCC